MKILITAGGTSESIDGVRKITNISTGETGCGIANRLQSLGYEVETLVAKDSPYAHTLSSQFHYFEDFDSLHNLFMEKLEDPEFSFVIHCAAVSDYKISKLSIAGKELSRDSKIPSGKESLVIEMLPTPKIISQVKKLRPDCKLLAFKFTNTDQLEERKKAIENLLSQSGADYVLWNDASLKNSKQHYFQILDRDQKLFGEGINKQQLYQCVENLVARYL